MNMKKFALLLGIFSFFLISGFAVANVYQYTDYANNYSSDYGSWGADVEWFYIENQSIANGSTLNITLYTCDVYLNVDINGIPVFTHFDIPDEGGGCSFPVIHTMTNSTMIAIEAPLQINITYNGTHSSNTRMGASNNCGNYTNCGKQGGNNVQLYADMNFGESVPSTCDSCSSCTSAVQGASSGDTVNLNTSIADFSDGTCVSFSGAVDNITFDCQGNVMDGDGINSNRAFYITTSNNTIKNCIINDTNGGSAAIYGDGGSYNTIINSSFSNLNSGSAIEFANGNHIQIINSHTAEGYFRIQISNDSTVIDSSAPEIDFYYITNNCTLSNSSMSRLGLIASNCVINENIISSPTAFGISIFADSGYDAINNFLFNNIINGSNYTYDVDTQYGIRIDSGNYLNTTLTTATNIIGGSKIGGNFWAYPNGTGFSQTCADVDVNDICDNEFVVNENVTDYLPLAAYSPPADIPSITIFSPTAITYATTSIALNVSANTTIDTWWYLLNGGANTTFTPNITITGQQGLNFLTVYANSTTGDEDSASVSFSVDSIVPIITIVLPQNTTYPAGNINFNATTDEIADSICLSVDDNATYPICVTSTDILSGYASNVTGGAYHFVFRANDSAGNYNWAGVYFTVDGTAPTITITSPTNTTYNSTTVNLRVTANEAINAWWYNLNGTNITFSPNTTLSLVNGTSYNLTVYANDSVGNKGSRSVSFNVYIPAPPIPPTPSPSIISNLGQFSVAAGVIIGAGFLMFLLEGLFGSASLIRNPKNLVGLIIGAMILAGIITVLFI